MTIAIEVRGLGKAYRLGQIGFHSFRRGLSRTLARRRRSTTAASGSDVQGARASGDLFWALRDVSFDVPTGEVVGIIGKNGAGKSTLLKILSRITEPTEGRAELLGRVSSLLEVGTGFHPELTGRENAYLSGAIFGMNRAEIRNKFDSIVDFAGIEEFIDTPVKRYSSGMYVRLAFAVAAHLEPDIMIVDEVLAVGDAEFQKKCLGKMGDVSRQGRTVLFVSHNMAMVKTLCRDCIWLENGRIRDQGSAASIVHSYLGQNTKETGKGEQDLKDWPNRYGEGPSRILKARMLDSAGNAVSHAVRGECITLEFCVQCDNREHLRFSCLVVADSGERLLHFSGHDTEGFAAPALRGIKTVRFDIPSLPLASGKFNWMIGLHAESAVALDVVSNVLPFEVRDIENSPRPYLTRSEVAFCWVPSTIRIADGVGW